MRLVSLLLLFALLSVFVGLAVPFSFASEEECGSCCAGERGDEDEDGSSAPCDTAECPCGFCLPALLPGAVDLSSPDSPSHRSPHFPSLFRLTSYSDGIDYPPEPAA